MSIFMTFKPEPEPPRRERKAPWDRTDSIALVASNNGVGCVLVYDGQGIECDFETEGSAALDSHCLDIAPDGLSIWEGSFQSSRDYYGEYDCWLEGEFRDLTEREWELLRTTGEPWEYEPCPRCADDGRIRCPNADCPICLTDKYCRDSEACSCGQQGWVTIDQVTLLGDEEVREYLAKVGEEVLASED